MVVMAHGVDTAVLKGARGCSRTEAKTGIGSRRIFPPHFKLQVLDSYRNDSDCKGNQRATARKYGIHRRQIQKWLQAEGNLRRSAGAECGEGGKCGIELALSGRRQRDDADRDAYSRVPSADDHRDARSARLGDDETADDRKPLDFTTHARADDLAAPMDLSLKRPPPADPPRRAPPVPRRRPPAPHQPTNVHHPATPLCLVRSPHHYEEQNTHVWDLSTKSLKRKHPHEEQPLHSPTSSTVSSTASKPAKLFKPYLDDMHDSSSSGDDLLQPKIEEVARYDDAHHAYYTNNNLYEVTSEYTYHDLHPSHPLYYYQHPHHPTIYEREPYDDAHPPTPLKQRQSYSLDFKLRTIECYYRDEMCRGNQRAVASKYNIHRRQVQKWLKQEDELRQRNDSVDGKVHAVR